MHIKKELVKVTTELDRNEKPYFVSLNAKPGDTVYISYSETVEKSLGLWNTPVKIISETPFFFRIDTGLFKTSISKASIYCNKEVLYMYTESE